MNSKDMGADVVLAWPTAAVAVMARADSEVACNCPPRRRWPRREGKKLSPRT